MAADFEKANPDIHIKPVYAGSYQDTIAKTLTALKGGDAPKVAVILSTDMFTLLDEDALVPFDRLAKTADDKARKSVVKGRSVAVRVDLGGRRIIKNKKKKTIV